MVYYSKMQKLIPKLEKCQLIWDWGYLNTKNRPMKEKSLSQICYKHPWLRILDPQLGQTFPIDNIFF